MDDVQYTVYSTSYDQNPPAALPGLQEELQRCFLEQLWDKWLLFGHRMQQVGVT